MTPYSRVVLFGAGASHGARPEPSPPLGDRLHVYVRQCLKAKWSELNYLEEGDGARISRVRVELDRRLSRAYSFEALADELLTQNNFTLLQKLNAVMAYALTPPINDDPRVDESFEEKPDMYDCFLSTNFPESRSLQSCSFITLNYDCLFERAICRGFSQESDSRKLKCSCEHVNYRLDDTRQLGVEVLKPHGSINWVADVTLGDGKIEEDSPSH